VSVGVTIDRARLGALLAAERDEFARRHPRSAAAYADARGHLFGGVPMTWMNKAAGGFPLYRMRRSPPSASAPSTAAGSRR
jgi:hypothetical protein